MANTTTYINKIVVPNGSDTITANLVDTSSGYTKNTGTVTSIAAGTGLVTDKTNNAAITISGTISLDTTRALTVSDITTGTDTTNKLVSAKTISDAIESLGGGSVDDVQVNGTSITTDGIANIPLVSTTVPGVMSAADKIKLNGIAEGAEVNVQSDWAVTDTTSDAFIKNKPTIANTLVTANATSRILYITTDIVDGDVVSY